MAEQVLENPDKVTASAEERIRSLINPETLEIPAGQLPERTLPPVSQSDAEAQAEQRAEEQAAPTDPPVERKAEATKTDTPRLLKVKVDGKEAELPEDEVVRGFQFNSHNTQTAMKLAEERKATQAAAFEAQQQREAFKAKLDATAEALKLLEQPAKDWAKLRQENPTEFAVQWAEYQQVEQAKERIAREQMAIRQQEAFEAAQQRHAFLAEQQQKLLDALPDWKDPIKKQQDDAKLLAAGQHYGYTAQELAQVTDHRAVLALRDAMLYRELMAQKASLPKAGTSPTLKPGAAAPSVTPADADTRYQAARDTLRKTGKPRDAAAAILAALNKP